MVLDQFFGILQSIDAQRKIYRQCIDDEKAPLETRKVAAQLFEEQLLKVEALVRARGSRVYEDVEKQAAKFLHQSWWQEKVGQENFHAFSEKQKRLCYILPAVRQTHERSPLDLHLYIESIASDYFTGDSFRLNCFELQRLLSQELFTLVVVQRMLYEFGQMSPHRRGVQAADVLGKGNRGRRDALAKAHRLLSWQDSYGKFMLDVFTQIDQAWGDSKTARTFSIEAFLSRLFYTADQMTKMLVYLHDGPTKAEFARQFQKSWIETIG